MYLNRFQYIQPYMRLGLVQKRCYEKAAVHRPKVSQEMNIHKANSDFDGVTPKEPIMTEMFPTTPVVPLVLNKEPNVLSFDEVPGPKAFKYIANVRQYISEMGTQLTVGMLTVALNVGMYFRMSTLGEDTFEPLPAHFNVTFFRRLEKEHVLFQKAI